MGLFKKNPIFIILIVLCLLAFGAGAYMAISKATAIDQAKQKITAAQARLDNLRLADPAPSEDNVEASEKNVERLKTVLTNIRDDLQQGSRLTTSDDGISVMASIQQYFSEYQRKAEQHTDSNGETDPIELPEDFAFGFEQYIDEATIPDDPAIIPVLDKQRQILSYLLNQLFSADPASIVSVQREVVENRGGGDQGEASGRQKGFQISPAVSARVPGAIDTLAFKLTFTGYTNTLREFINNLAKFDLPIVVRSIEVERPAGQVTTTQRSETNNNNNLDDIFGAFGGSDGSGADDTSGAEQAVPEKAQEPVIAENVSTFSVVLEFIEVVLPAESAEEKAIVSNE